VQAAFTPAEIKEFGELSYCDPIVDLQDLQINPESQTELEDPNSPIRKKNFEILKEYAARGVSQKDKKFIIQFYKGPKELRGNGRVEKVILEKNRLTGAAGAQQAVGTGQTEEISCGIFFRSVGYRGVPIPGVPFDEKKGIFPNMEGRITDNGKIIPGLYAVGWIKRGPSGVIGTNKPDSVATVQNLIADAPNFIPCATPDTQALINLLKSRNVHVVSFADWKKIDAAEISRGQPLGKPREKFLEIEQMLQAIG